MCHLGVSWGHFGHFGVTLSCEDYFRVKLGRFQKTFIFTIDFNDFIQLLGHLGATLGPIFVEIMEDKGRTANNGAPKWHVDVGWHL